MGVAVHSDKLRELVDENAEVEQVATGCTFTEGPIWMPDGSLHFSDMPGDKRRRWHPAEGVTVLRDPSNKCNGMTLDNDGNLIVCEHVTSSVVRESPDGTRETLATHWQRQGAEQPERRGRRARRLDHLHRPDLRAHAGLRPRARAGARLPGRLPPRRRRGRARAAGRRLRPAERALLLDRRVAALHQRHRPRAHPRLRGRRRPLALERPRVRRGHRRRRPREGRPSRRDEARRARQRLRHRPRRRLGLRSRGRAPRHDRDARERRQPELGRRRLEHALHRRLDLASTASG